ncbi:YigZ family protein [Geobacillus zalihae]|uniref:YigZ family protein n=1 Tax=Geobacillus zalihae TaxID=213419 RepID=UPI0009BEA8C8|nr:YigZ family protein [Geobacillus zalihae]OQP17298.1 YigZ family protein [Geobacillus zalihae]QNU23341.1 YigZ family protein [Geobacillus zalihae]WKA47136.1 YigZ family protein [Geobacillus zalihae]
MLQTYYTVKGYGEREIVIEKSRFICYINRAETEEEAVAFIQQIKKKHWDATHNCSAYLIGEHDQIQKANDDGEPSGTAGVPMLEVLKKKGLKDTVAVVTRYFGGIKLGAGGLVRAYSRAVSEGLNAAGIVERRLMRVMRVTIDYPWLGKVENELRSSVYTIKNIQYADRVTFDVLVPEDGQSSFGEWMTELTNGRADIQAGAMEYAERLLSSS